MQSLPGSLSWAEKTSGRTRNPILVDIASVADEKHNGLHMQGIVSIRTGGWTKNIYHPIYPSAHESPHEFARPRWLLWKSRLISENIWKMSQYRPSQIYIVI